MKNGKSDSEAWLKKMENIFINCYV